MFIYYIIIIVLGYIKCQNKCNYKGNYNLTTKKCECLEDYISIPNSSNLECNYELRSGKIALFLSIFGGIFGADRFYLGNNIKAFIKVCLPIIIFKLITLIHNRYEYLTK